MITKLWQERVKTTVAQIWQLAREHSNGRTPTAGEIRECQDVLTLENQAILDAKLDRILEQQDQILQRFPPAIEASTQCKNCDGHGAVIVDGFDGKDFGASCEICQGTGRVK